MKLGFSENKGYRDRLLHVYRIYRIIIVRPLCLGSDYSVKGTVTPVIFVFWETDEIGDTAFIFPTTMGTLPERDTN